MAVNKEMWRPDIIESLFKSNAWLSRSFNADEYVVGGRIVHIPQAGAPSNVERNRVNLPAPIVKRNDTDILYSLDEYTSDPRLIPDIDKKELSYDKRQSVIREDTGKMMEVAGDNMLYNWAKNVPSGFKVVTTGGNAAATAPGATGNRKIITQADVRKAQTTLNLQNVPKEGRVLILPSNMLDQLMSDVEVQKLFQMVINVKEGSLGRVWGFDIYERSSVLIETNGGTVKLPEAASATDDNECALFYYENHVERALGDVEIFDNPNQAAYYGDLISFLLRLGGRNRREDNKGVGLICARA
ncbi:MAG: hypothetical protein EPGJADBJ_04472 [Saprospiraceae bacterium]|nr:hypothetical protein [Saprospiraceae bacterium]